MTQTDKQVKQLDRVIIRFAGDSGDGMQLTGDRFTQETAAFGNDLVTLPNFPAEIRAPQGTLPGVSSFQVHFADHDILTAGDAPDVLVAMNPAALRANLGDLHKGATIIVDTHDFTARNLAKAGYTDNPLDGDTLDEYALHTVDLTGMTIEAVKEFGLSRKDASRAKKDIAAGQPKYPARVAQIGNCFSNQFEVPLLFYFLIALALPLRHADLFIVLMSWVFVVTRFAHAGVFVSSNDPGRRSTIWLAGVLVLLAMWIYFALKMLLLI